MELNVYNPEIIELLGEDLTNILFKNGGTGPDKVGSSSNTGSTTQTDSSMRPTSGTAADITPTTDNETTSTLSDLEKARELAIHNKVIDSIFADEFIAEVKKFKDAMTGISKAYSKRIDFLDTHPLVSEPQKVDVLTLVLQDQSDLLDQYTANRQRIAKSTVSNLPPEIKAKFEVIDQKLRNIRATLLKDIDDLRDLGDKKKQMHKFFVDLNAYRNKVHKENNAYETLWREEFKKHFPDLCKLKEYKQFMNTERQNSIKEVVDKDNYLRKKISEIINPNNK